MIAAGVLCPGPLLLLIAAAAVVGVLNVVRPTAESRRWGIGLAFPVLAIGLGAVATERWMGTGEVVTEATALGAILTVAAAGMFLAGLLAKPGDGRTPRRF